MHDDIQSLDQLYSITRKRTALTKKELKDFWDRYKTNKPFVVDFLYAHSFPKRPNLKKLIELGVIPDIQDMPRGFRRITVSVLDKLLNFVYN